MTPRSSRLQYEALKPSYRYRQAPPPRMLPHELLFFRMPGATLKEAHRALGHSASWWAQAATEELEAGYLMTPGTSPRWILTLFGELELEPSSVRNKK